MIINTIEESCSFLVNYWIYHLEKKLFLAINVEFLHIEVWFTD